MLGLAPGAHGSNRTGRVFTGDRNGDWLYRALYHYGFASQPHSTDRDDGLRLEDCYVTAAVRCVPPANKPTCEERTMCQPYLAEELCLLRRLCVVVVLGKIAFDQYLKTCRDLDLPVPRPRLQFGHGAHYRLPWGPSLIASYHPSQQNTFTGKLTRRMFHAVFRKARTCLREKPVE